MASDYQFDAERWLRSNAALYERKGSLQMARNMAMCADELKRLREEVSALKVVVIHVYNSGYHAGHYYTVEGGYVDIHSNDMDTYHAEEVSELLAALVGEEEN